MRIYIGYQYIRNDKEKLKKDLLKISKIFESNDNNTFIFSRDIENWEDEEIDVKDIFPTAFREIKKSDILFIYIDKYYASTGIGLEIGYAKALGIPIVIAMNEEDNYLIGVYDKLIKYKDFDDLLEKLRDF